MCSLSALIATMLAFDIDRFGQWTLPPRTGILIPFIFVSFVKAVGSILVVPDGVVFSGLFFFFFLILQSCLDSCPLLLPLLLHHSGSSMSPPESLYFSFYLNKFLMFIYF